MSYWTDRQEQLKEAAEKDEAKIKKRLSSFYDSEFRRMDKEIAAYFTKYGKDNVIEYRVLMQSLPEEDKKLLMEQMDEFARKYPQYADLMPVRESIYRLDRLQGLQYSVYMAQANIAGYTDGQVREYETKLAHKGLNYAMETLGFGKNFYSINSDVVRQFVGVAWSNGENFSTNIWKNTEKLANYLNQDMAQAFARGDSYDAIYRNLKRRFDKVNRNDAYRLIYTEGTYVMAESTMQPFTGDFEQYRLSPVLDGKTCPICKGLREQTFLISERRAGVNFPPIHPWCRCSFEIVVDDWDAWMDGYVAKHGGETHKTRATASKIIENVADGGKIEMPSVNSDAYKKLIDGANADKVTYNDVQFLMAELSNSEIIARLAGGDMTKGSCSSLGFAYIGNKCGLDVLDFRGGKSQDFFSRTSTIKQMLDLPGVKGSIAKVKKEAADTAKIIEALEYNKEYYLSVGKHAAIIRNTDGGLEYLELQSPDQSGWTSFKKHGSTVSTLRKRFGCRKTPDRMKVGNTTIIFEKEVVLMEVDSFKNNDEFKKILGYINTTSNKQHKGTSGNVK